MYANPTESYGSDNGNSTMEASASFETLLKHVESQLNYKLELSPFSAVISLKKSFIKDKSGNVLQPILTNYSSIQVNQSSFLKTRILSLDNENEKLKADYTFAVNDCEEAHGAVAKLEREIERIFNVKNESSDAVNKLEMLKSKFEVLEKKRKLKGLLNCRKIIKLK